MYIVNEWIRGIGMNDGCKELCKFCILLENGSRYNLYLCQRAIIVHDKGTLVVSS